MNPTEQLAQLEQAQLVHALPEILLAYSFKHVLVQATAYETLLRHERRVLHGWVAETIERTYPEQLNDNAALLAEHYWLAEEWQRAAEYSQRAGANALRLYALREAMSHFERAQNALDKLDSAPLPDKIDALLGWSHAAVRFVPYAEQLQRLERAETYARALNDKLRLALVLHGEGSAHMARGHNLRAAPIFGECFALADELGDEQLTVMPTYFMGTLRQDDDPRAALTLFDAAIRLARKYHNADVVAAAAGMKAMTYARLGEASAAQDALVVAFTALADVKSPMTESDVMLYAAWSYLDMGDVARGLEYGQRGVDKAHASENMDCVCYGYTCLGFGNLRALNTGQANESFQEAIRRSHFTGATQVENLAQAGLAMTKIFGGDTSALADLEGALRDAQALGSQFSSALIAATLGEIYLRVGDAERASAYLDSAQSYFERTALRPYLEHTQALQAQVKQLPLHTEA